MWEGRRLDFYVHLHIGVVQLRTLKLVLYLLDPDEFDEARLNLSLLLRYPLGIRRGGCCPVSFDIRRTGEKTMCGTYDSESVRALRAWASRSSRTVIRSIGVLRGLGGTRKPGGAVRPVGDARGRNGLRGGVDIS